MSTPANCTTGTALPRVLDVELDQRQMRDAESVARILRNLAWEMSPERVDYAARVIVLRLAHDNGKQAGE